MKKIILTLCFVSAQAFCSEPPSEPPPSFNTEQFYKDFYFYAELERQKQSEGYSHSFKIRALAPSGLPHSITIIVQDKKKANQQNGSKKPS